MFADHSYSPQCYKSYVIISNEIWVELCEIPREWSAETGMKMHQPRKPTLHTEFHSTIHANAVKC